MVYVLASVPSGGDGSEASPLSTITAALALASRGTILAVGKGEYDEALRLPPAVTLWGACAAETRLTASSWGPLAQGVITVPSADTRVTNLRVGSAELPGIVVYGSRASLVVDGVIIDSVRGVGLRVMSGGHVEGIELVVSGTRADDGNEVGPGIIVSTAGTVDLRRAWISRNQDFGVFAEDHGTSLTLANVAVRDTGAGLSGGLGRGLAVQQGAAATVIRALFSRNRDISVFAAHEGTSLSLSDVVIRDTQGRQSDGGGGRALNVQEGATATVIRGLLANNRELGAFAGDEGTSLSFSDIVIRDTQGRESDGKWGRALGAEQHATITVTRGLLADNHELGAFAADEGTSLSLSDVVIRDTLGRALSVQGGATATVTRGHLTGNRDVGVFVQGSNTSLVLADVAVRETHPRESGGTLGRALNLQEGATTTVTRGLLDGNHDLGVFVDGGSTSLTLADMVIRDTQAQQSDGLGGRALNVQEGAVATVTRALLANNRDVGVVATSPGTAVRLLDVVVSQTAEQVCANTTCTEKPSGMGLLGGDHADLSATRFAVTGGALCGVMVAQDAQIDLAVGEVSAFQIGVCLQVDGYTVMRLTDRVRYINNDLNLDTTSLPVPDLPISIEGL